MPAQGTFAAGIITVLCAVMYFYRRVRYVDSNSLHYWVSNIATAYRDRERLRLNAQAIRWTMIAGAGLGFAVFTAFYIADAGLKITFASASFLVLVFGFSSFQLSFVPLVLGPLIAGSDGRGNVSPGWALAIMGVSAAVAVGTTAAYLATKYDALLSLAVPGCLGSAALLFLTARLWLRRAQAAT